METTLLNNPVYLYYSASATGRQGRAAVAFTFRRRSRPPGAIAGLASTCTEGWFCAGKR
jgi:hypothetical protein